MKDRNKYYLKRLYEFYKVLKTEFDNYDVAPEYFTGEAGNPNTLKCRIFEFATSLFSRGDFPQILSNDEYQELNSGLLYHGYRDFDHGANMICHFNYHRGQGMYGCGLYVKDDKNKAFAYTKFDNLGDVNEWNIDKVLEMKYLSEKSIINLKLKNLSTLVSGGKDVSSVTTDRQEINNINDIYEFVKTEIQDEYMGKKFLRMFDLDPSILALYLGYDRVDIYNRDFVFDQAILLDRGKVVVNENEAKKFIEKSDHYKSGSFDFVYDTAKE